MSVSSTDFMGISSAGAGTSGSVREAAEKSKENSEISMTDFFQLLSAQMQNQTMYDSVDTGEYMSQLVQYTTLAQIQELNASAATSYAVSMIGKQVSLLSEDESGNEILVSGAVEGVAFEDGTPYICVGGGFYETSEILSVCAGE